MFIICFFFFFQAEDGIRDRTVTGVQTCALPIWRVGHESRTPTGPAVRESSLSDQTCEADLAGSRRAPYLEEESHDYRIPELTARAAIVLHAAALLDEVELAVESDRGLIVWEDLERELV